MKINTLTELFCIASMCIALFGCSDVNKLQPLAEDAVILSFGDSLTYGTGTKNDTAYPAILQRLTQRRVINAGIPGEITQQGLQRLPKLIKQYKPALIILCHGGNDILRKMNLVKTKSNLQQMISLARQNNAEVVLVAVPEFGLFLSASPIYQDLADDNKLPIEKNVLSEILADNALKSDHIHPNTEGYRLFAERIFNLLKSTGAITTK